MRKISHKKYLKYLLYLSFVSCWAGAPLVAAEEPSRNPGSKKKQEERQTHPTPSQKTKSAQTSKEKSENISKSLVNTADPSKKNLPASNSSIIEESQTEESQWLQLDSGTRQAYAGIHGGTSPLSLARASNGMIFALSGQTGYDFVFVLQGNNTEGKKENKDKQANNTQANSSQANVQANNTQVNGSQTDIQANSTQAAATQTETTQVAAVQVPATQIVGTQANNLQKNPQINREDSSTHANSSQVSPQADTTQVNNAQASAQVNKTQVNSAPVSAQANSSQANNAQISGLATDMQTDKSRVIHMQAPMQGDTTQSAPTQLNSAQANSSQTSNSKILSTQAKPVESESKASDRQSSLLTNKSVEKSAPIASMGKNVEKEKTSLAELVQSSPTLLAENDAAGTTPQPVKATENEQEILQRYASQKSINSVQKKENIAEAAQSADSLKKSHTAPPKQSFTSAPQIQETASGKTQNASVALNGADSRQVKSSLEENTEQKMGSEKILTQKSAQDEAISHEQKISNDEDEKIHRILAKNALPPDDIVIASSKLAQELKETGVNFAPYGLTVEEVIPVVELEEPKEEPIKKVVRHKKLTLLSYKKILAEE